MTSKTLKLCSNTFWVFFYITLEKYINSHLLLHLVVFLYTLSNQEVIELSTE